MQRQQITACPDRAAKRAEEVEADCPPQMTNQKGMEFVAADLSDAFDFSNVLIHTTDQNQKQ